MLHPTLRCSTRASALKIARVESRAKGCLLPPVPDFAIACILAAIIIADECALGGSVSLASKKPIRQMQITHTVFATVLPVVRADDKCGRPQKEAQAEKARGRTNKNDQPYKRRDDNANKHKKHGKKQQRKNARIKNNAETEARTESEKQND